MVHIQETWIPPTPDEEQVLPLDPTNEATSGRPKTLRAEIEEELYELMDSMDPKGKNTLRVKNFFAGMTDIQFYRFMDNYYSDPDKFIPVGYEPYDNPVTLNFAHAVAKKYKVPIYETVYRPYVTGDKNNPPGTIQKMMVLEEPVKRLKQTTNNKNHVSTAANKRDPRTGQVAGEDRTARVTDAESYSLMAQGQYHAAQEYFGPMGDDMVAHYEMLRQIERNGEVNLRDLPNDPINKVSLNTINALMLGSGLECNWISQNGYVLPRTLKGNEERTSTIDRG